MNSIEVFDAGDRLVLKSYQSIINVFLSKDEQIEFNQDRLVDLTNAQRVYEFEPISVGESVSASFLPIRRGVVVKHTSTRTVYICERVADTYMWKDTKNLTLSKELEEGSYKILDLGD